MNSHRITFEGIEFEVYGEYEKSENETGFRGGWVSYKIEIDGNDLLWALNQWTIDRINELIVDENY